jgi:hypothetical protein
MGILNLNGLLDAIVPLILIMFFIKMAMSILRSLGLGNVITTGMILRDRRQNKVSNDATDRDYLALVKSCKSHRTIARKLIMDPTGDGDLQEYTVGRILGISPRPDFIAIYLKPATLRRMMLIVFPDMISTLDRPEVRVYGRSTENYSEVWWIVTPLRNSEYFTRLEQYKRKCHLAIDSISKFRLIIDNQGDMDCQAKSSMRREMEPSALREINDSINPNTQGRMQDENDYAEEI